MRALVVYESLWGNTAAVGKAIAEGIGEGARAVTTAEADAALAEGVDLIVAGSPLLGFSLPTDSMRDSIRTNPQHAGHPPDLGAPAMRTWLDGLTPGTGRAASFETRIWWSPGSAAKAIMRKLEALGYRSAAEPARFIVTGTYGPLKDGELDRARAWGEQLARAMA